MIVSSGGDVYTLQSSGVIIDNNFLYKLGLNGILNGQGIRIINGSTGVIISHNRIQNVSGKGIHLGHFTSSHPMNSLTKDAPNVDRHYSIDEYLPPQL